MVSLFVSLLTLSSVFLSPTKAHPASPLGIAVVKEQFKNALLTPNIIPTFDPSGLLLVNYTKTMPSFLTGAAVSKANVTQPRSDIEVSIRGTAQGFLDTSSPYNDTTSKYTLLMFDAGYPGANDTEQFNLHYLHNNLGYAEKRHDAVLLGGNSTPVVEYAAPNPPGGSGPHRYVWLVYREPAGFTAPATPAPGGGVALWNFEDYIGAAKLGNPFAGNFFTVEEGQATVSVAQTKSVDSTTLPQYTPSSSSSGGHASGSATPAPTSAALHVRFNAGVAGIALIAGFFLLLL